MYRLTKRGRIVGYLTAEARKEAETLISLLQKEGCTDTIASLEEKSDIILERIVSELEPGDMLIVPNLDALRLDMHGIVRLISRLYRDSIGFRSVEENISLPAIGKFCQKLDRYDRISGRSGDEGAKPTLQRRGRPTKLTPDILGTILSLSSSKTPSEIANAVGLSRSTVARCLRQYRTSLPDNKHRELQSSKLPDQNS